MSTWRMLTAADNGVAPELRGGLRIGAACEQQVDHRAMTATGRAQQRGAALRIGGIDRQAEVEQATHRIGFADDRGRRQVRRLQRTTGQRPAAPVEPVGEVATARRQRDAERRLPVGGAQVRARRRVRSAPSAPLRDRARRPGATRSCRGGSRAFEIDADARAGVRRTRRPAQAHRQRQRRIAGRRGARTDRRRVRAVPARAVPARDRRDRSARTRRGSAPDRRRRPATRRGAAAPAAAGSGDRTAREQREHRRVAEAIARCRHRRLATAASRCAAATFAGAPGRAAASPQFARARAPRAGRRAVMSSSDRRAAPSRSSTVGCTIGQRRSSSPSHRLTRRGNG